MASVLGFTLAAVLAVGRGSLPGIFTSDTAVQALVVALLPAVILSQPINAAAFVWDGVLFGAGGFRCVVSAVCMLVLWTVPMCVVLVKRTGLLETVECGWPLGGSVYYLAHM